jgi:[ribosomal protein S5]-alanine N-acetyltransferase
MLMAESTIIETERLIIEPFSPEHLTERYVAWLGDPEVVRFSEQRHVKHTLESCRAYLESFSGTPNFFWALVAKDSDIGHLGNMTAYVDNIRLSADIGILIGERRIWNKGYGREAWLAVCKYLFEYKGLSQITAGTLSVNQPMLGIMRSIGMVRDDLRNGKSVYEGVEVDFHYGILHREAFLPENRRRRSE